MSDTGESTQPAKHVEEPRNRWWSRFIRYIKGKVHERHAKKQAENSQDRAARRTAAATVWMAIFTLVLTVVSGGTLLILKRQLKEMHEGGIDTHALADATGKMKDSAEKSAQASRDFADSAGAINASVGEAVKKLDAQAKATQGAANAATSAANIEARQFASSQQLIESQQASISVAFGRVFNPITFHDGSASIVFSVILQNTGALKATHASLRFKPYYQVWGQSMFTRPLEEQRDFCATPLPPEQGVAYEDGKAVDLKGLRDDTFIVEPHAPYEHQLNFGMGKPAEREIIKWPPTNAVKENPSLVVTDRIYPFVVGCVDYQSGAMPERHQTGFIFEIQEAYVDAAVPNAAPTLIHYGVDIPRERVLITQYFFGQGKKY